MKPRDPFSTKRGSERDEERLIEWLDAASPLELRVALIRMFHENLDGYLVLPGPAV